MDKNKLVRKLYAYRQDPELYRAPSNEDLADLVILVLNAVKTIENSMEKKRVDVEKKYDNEANSILTKTEKQSRKLLLEVQTEVNRLINDSQTVLGQTKQELETRVQQALENIRNGRDGTVTDDEIERAASIAAKLIKLPDFDFLISERITANPEAIRNALELLSGEERYKVEIADVQGLQGQLESLMRSNKGGTIGKGQVYGFIRQAVADGTISTSSGLPDGGTTGQALIKQSNDDGDADWESLPGGGDMLTSVYDPAAGARQVAFSDELPDDTDDIAEGATNLYYTEARVSANTNVAANTAARHDAVTVTDSDEINFTLTGQAITAVIKAASIVKSKLASAVQASLDLADSAVQPGDLATVATTGAYSDLSGTPDLSVYDNFEAFANQGDFPVTGSSEVLYLETSTGTLFRWTGSGYVEISAQLALGETSSTAYRGDRGKIAYDHSQVTTGNPHNVTKAEVGLGNVPNTDFTAAVNANTAKRSYPTADENKLAGIEAGAEVNTLNDVIAGTNVSIDKTDPLNPVISSTATGGGSPGGADTQVQFNDGGVFGAISDFIYDKVLKRLKLTGTNDILQIEQDTNGVGVRFTNTNSSSSGAGMAGYQDRGAATPDGSRLGFFLFGGAYNATNDLRNSVLVGGYATEDWDDTKSGSKYGIEVTTNGTNTRNIVTEFDEDGVRTVGVYSTLSGNNNVLRTNSQNSEIEIIDGANGDVNIKPHGTGEAQVNGDKIATETDLDAKSDRVKNIRTETASATFALTDDIVEMNVGTANTITVPPNSSVAFPVGTLLFVVQIGAGSTTVTAGSGVTINNPTSVPLEIDEEDGARAIYKRATDTWQLV